jgi:RHS repeat-associated protein
VGGVTTKFLVDTENPTGLPQVMDEIVSGSVTRTYAYGLQRISEDQLIASTWTPSFYGYDGHGNVRFLTNSAGAITDSYDYDAFGLPITTTGTTPNNYLYSGEQYDGALGVYYLRARYYDPATGRLLTADTYQGRILDPATLQKYVYAQNDPVDGVDPAGRDAIVEVAFVYIRFSATVPVRDISQLLLEMTALQSERQATYLEFGYHFIHGVHFAKDLGECDEAGLQLAANALDFAFTGSTAQEQPSEKFPDCIPKALWTVLQPVPGLNLPPYPGP